MGVTFTRALRFKFLFDQYTQRNSGTKNRTITKHFDDFLGYQRIYTFGLSPAPPIPTIQFLVISRPLEQPYQFSITFAELPFSTAVRRWSFGGVEVGWCEAPGRIQRDCFCGEEGWLGQGLEPGGLGGGVGTGPEGLRWDLERVARA